MAETESGETIRSMITGFNAMQAQLGLLPVQKGAQPMGVTLPPPPPPPEIMSPGVASSMANQQMLDSTRQTVEVAQMTRYTPPPSSPPIGGGGAQVSGGGLGGMGMNPFVSQAMGGGQAQGGLLSMPHPMMMTAPMYGAYRPPGGAGMPQAGAGHIPAPVPFAAHMPAGQFGQPYQRDYRVMQGRQGAAGAGADAAFKGALATGGSLVGGGIGYAFGGPIGSMVGSYIGGKALPAIGGLVTGQAMSDIEKGRRIQNMTSSYMVGGDALNPFTGQGMHREAAQETARGIRRMTRDHVFERQTGFNTADVRKITQLASDEGMLETSQGSEDVLRKVKALSKSVRVLMAVTGDPDVKAAMKGLGQMKHLGFEGLMGQTGAVVNRAELSRMAGISQAGMTAQYGAPGAMLAQQSGMVGATGFTAGMMGGAAANTAVGAGTFSDLQKARAGGRQGIAQSNMMAYLGAANQDTYMAAALTRGDDGQLTVDASAYKKAQGADFREVARMAEANMNKLGRQGIEELATRKQELKDEVAQKMGPFGMQMNWRKQVQGLKEATGQTTGAAIMSQLGSTELGAGMSRNELESASRTLELEYNDPDALRAQKQQLQVQRRGAIDRERAKRSRRRTPGMMTRLGEGLRDFKGGISDAVTGWSDRNIFEPLARGAEDRAAQNRGERVQRFSNVELIQNEEQRQAVAETMMTRGFQDTFADTGGGPTDLDALRDAATNAGRGAVGGIIGLTGKTNRMGNRFKHMLGFGSYSEENFLASVASKTKGTFGGFHPLGSFGDKDDSLRRIRDVQGAARASIRSAEISETSAVASNDKIGEEAAAMGIEGFDINAAISGATTNMISAARHNKQGAGSWYHFGQKSATGMSEGLMKKAFIKDFVDKGRGSESQGEQLFEKNPEIAARMAQGAYATGDRKLIEQFDIAEEANVMMGAYSGAKDRKGIRREAKKTFEEAGIGGISDKTLGLLGSSLESEDEVTMMYAVAAAGRQMTKGRDNVESIDEEAKEMLRARGITDEKELEAAVTKFTQRGQAVAGKLTADDGGRWAMKGLAMQGGPLAERLAGIKGETRKLQGGATAEYFIKKLAAKAGGDETVANAGGVYEAMQRVQLDTLTDKDSWEYKMAKRVKEPGADRAQLEEEIVRYATENAPMSARELIGGEGGAEVRGIDEQIREIDKEIAKIRKDPKEATDTDIAVLQAESSSALAKAAGKLDNVADTLGIIVTDYRYQGGR